MKANTMRETMILARRSPAADLPAIRELLSMLTYMRPARSPTEHLFVHKYVAPLGTTPDAYGNHWLTIGASPILWSCHTDTVHKVHGKQSVEYGDGYVTTSTGSCLGADCTAGVWLMANMIRAGIPGTYVFHREEETGGQGSEFIQTHTPERLAGIQFAVAFDRRGTSDIVTRQYNGRTASDAFARSFSAALGIELSPTDGTFTDTANYAGLVPECSNISVGYDKAHSSHEYLDVVYLVKLCRALLKADFSTLEAHREPGTDDWPGPKDPWDVAVDNDLQHLVWEHPADVAAFLEANGFTADDLIRFIAN